MTVNCGSSIDCAWGCLGCTVEQMKEGDNGPFDRLVAEPMPVARAEPNLLNLLSRMTTIKVDTFGPDSDNPETEEPRPETSIEAGANAVTSLAALTKGSEHRTHYVALDIDFPAYVVPSSTPGHSHLYIDFEIGEEQYLKLLEALEIVGLIEPGYANASRERKATHLRLPWVKKEAVA